MFRLSLPALFLFLGLSACATQERPAEPGPLEPSVLPAQLSAVLLEDFLDVEGPHENPLLNLHRKGEAIEQVLSPKSWDKPRLKLLLFYTFSVYASRNHEPASSQLLLSSLVPIFEKNKEAWLHVFKELPVPVSEAACSYLAGHFGFEDVPEAKRGDFWQRHRAGFEGVLAESALKRCEGFFKQAGRPRSPHRP